MQYKPEDYSVSFYLGRVQSPEQQLQLEKIAGFLDQNKFSCTFSIIEGRAHFDIDPHVSPDHKVMTPSEFKFYAAEHVMYQLSRALGRIVLCS